VNYPFKAKTKLNHDRKNTEKIRLKQQRNRITNGNTMEINPNSMHISDNTDNRKLRITPHTTQISHNNTIKDTKQ